MEEGGIDVSNEIGLREYFMQDDIDNYNRNSLSHLNRLTLPMVNLERMIRLVFNISRDNEIGLRNRERAIDYFVDKFVPETQPVLKGGKHFKKYKKSRKSKKNKKTKKYRMKTTKRRRINKRTKRNK